MDTTKSLRFKLGLVIVLAILYAFSLTGIVISPYMLGGEEFETWELLLNSILIAIPLGILHALVGILIMAIYQHRQYERFNPRLAKWLYWSPRICCIVLLAFMSLFAFDVFEEGYTMGEMLLGFLMHMLPMIVMAIVLLIAWRWSWVGSVIFGSAALLFSIWTLRDGIQAIGTILVIGAPLLMIALLFGANAQWKQEIAIARHSRI